MRDVINDGRKRHSYAKAKANPEVNGSRIVRLDAEANRQDPALKSSQSYEDDGAGTHAAAPVWRAGLRSASFKAASSAESVFIDAPIGFGFLTLHFQRENVVG